MACAGRFPPVLALSDFRHFMGVTDPAGAERRRFLNLTLRPSFLDSGQGGLAMSIVDEARLLALKTYKLSLETR
jgi:hypothetical protein